eukprot:gnl/MRDRNA2_/MRDRNA2_76016_c0_seq1.p2 gnl/MRDRNA2_/MRDRNA2_76016_c0~~gnl/MRDRNA2_/MRDRNA2_76016_c0_seq1.p2  ORF type:complete len:106 (-),score=12.37 gnl/MRDRNA2_/MRDRNA2_76016_c0_seq1:363-647(-)
MVLPFWGNGSGPSEYKYEYERKTAVRNAELFLLGGHWGHIGADSSGVEELIPEIDADEHNTGSCHGLNCTKVHSSLKDTCEARQRKMNCLSNNR